MWLVDTSSLQLEYFSNAPYHTYAILSHTWEFEEVTFQDMQNGKAKDRLGYAKVLGTCAKAKSHGLRWVWMDTCCINKESSAELSEAINSMFTWYARSAVCYALLSDVSKQQVWLDWADGDLETLAILENDALAMLTCDDEKWQRIASQCRWFKRGWTLQELIAPSDLRFFTRDWSYMGSKKNLLVTLWHATGIDPLALEDYQSLPKFTIARRMAWAAGRWTTRIEDRAYSLFGLFGVSMPLLYGEGERAFIRLQEELVRTSTDHSVFAWKPAADQLRISRSRRDVRESLFARSPDDYRAARRVVRWHADEDGHKSSKPFRLTNRGVDFDGVYIAETDVGKLALLNCRFEDKPQGPIALRIIEDEAGGGAEKDCFVDYDHRLTVYDWRTRQGLQYRARQTILRRPPEPPLDLTSTAPAAMFHIVSESESEEIDIYNPSPNAMWNQSTGVMCPPFLDRTSARREVVGSATVRGRASGITFSLAFKASRRVWARTLRLALSVHSQAEAQQLLDMQDNGDAQPGADDGESTEYDDSDSQSSDETDRRIFHSLGYDGEEYEGEKYPGEKLDKDEGVRQARDSAEESNSKTQGPDVPIVFAPVPHRPGAFARLKDIKHIADNVYYIIEVSTGWARSASMSPTLTRSIEWNRE